MADSVSATGAFAQTDTDDAPAGGHSDEVLVRVRNLKKHFPIKRGVLRRTIGHIKAVDGISFDIYKGETLGLVGERGSGKSTAGRTILQLEEPTAGTVQFAGRELTTLSRADIRRARRHMQMIFHDPYASLNPRLTVGDIISEPLVIHDIGDSAGRKVRVQELLRVVGLNPYFANRYPHEFSGSQRLRIGVARALATNPAFIVANDPISALDVSIQGQIINMFDSLKQELGLTCLFIAHDLSLARHSSDRIAVMYLGRIAELGTRNEVYHHPLHPYTQTLLSAAPTPAPNEAARRQEIMGAGDMPGPSAPPPGCRFHPRCAHATELCRQVEPELRNLGTAAVPHMAACHYAEKFL